MRRRLLTVLLAATLAASAFAGCSRPGREAPEVAPLGGDAKSGEAPAGGPAPMPEPRTEVAGALWGDAIVVVGGLRADGQASGRADSYDPASNTWTRLPDLPMSLHHTAVAALRDRVWVVGGYTVIEGDIFVPTRVAYSLGRGDDRWREEDLELATLRGAAAAATTRAGIVVAGGVGGDGEVIASTETLCAGCSTTEPGPPMLESREHFALAAAETDLYAIAGRVGGAGANKTSVEVLRGGSSTWEEGPALAIARGGIGAAILEGRPCVAGGETETVTIAEVECLNGDRWEVVARLATPRHGLAVVAFGGRLHVIGGGPEPGLTVSGTHEVFDIPPP